MAKPRLFDKLDHFKRTPDIIRLYESREKIEHIGALVGLHPSNVRKIAQRYGAAVRKRGRPKRRRHTAGAGAQADDDLGRFIRAHLAVLAGTDFFAVEVLTWRGLVTYYVLFFIHLESRRVDIAGITDHPTEQWMQQTARNATMEGCGVLETAAISFTIPTRSTQLPPWQSLSRCT
jgi:hypothetical protein